MAFHVRDPKTDALVRELARQRGIGITEAIREVVEEALATSDNDAARRRRAGELRKRLQPLFDEIGAMPKTGFVADKRFYDELWGQEDERGISVGEAVHRAVEAALADEQKRPSLWDRTADLRAKVQAFPLTGEVADKRFFDSLSGQEDD